MRTACYSLLGTVGIMLAAACGGESGGITTPPPPPPPPTETVTVSQNLSNGSTITTVTPYVSVSATATSSKTQIGDMGVSWTVNGVSVATGRSVSVKLTIGTNRVCVKAQGLEKSAESCVDVTFNPQFSCKIVVANPDNESLGSANLNITFARGTNTASKSIASNGDCSMAGLITQEDTLKVVVTDASGNRVIIPSIGYIAKADMAKGVTIILPPTVWPIKTGSFAGQSVSIDLSLAYKAGSDGLSFYPRTQQGSGWIVPTAAYDRSKFPLPAAVKNDLSKSGQVLGPVEEGRIWADVDRLEVPLGWDILRKADTSEVSNQKGVAFYSDSTAYPPSYGRWSARGGSAGSVDLLYGGVVYWEPLVTIANGTTVHELLHVLGFGHGCGWSGSQTAHCESSTGYVPRDITKEDVAYIHLYYRIRELERKYNTRFSLAEASVGQEVLQQNLPEKVIVK